MQWYGVRQRLLLGIVLAKRAVVRGGLLVREVGVGLLEARVNVFIDVVVVVEHLWAAFREQLLEWPSADL